MQSKRRAATWKRLRLLGACALVGWLASAEVSLAQTPEDALRFSQRFPSTGPRVMAMGGASIAGIADYAALFGNPAGLAYYERSEISGAFNTLLARDASFYRTPGFGTALDRDVSATSLGNLAYVYKFPTKQGSLVFGAAFNQVNSFERDLRFRGPNGTNSITHSYLPYDDEYGFDADGNLDITGDIPYAAYQAGAIDFRQDLDDAGLYPFVSAVASSTTIGQGGNVTETGRMSEVNVGGAVEAAPGTMFGLSVNIPFGTYRFNRIFEETDDDNENMGDLYSIPLDDGSMLSGFDAFQIEDRIKSDLVGVNVRGGLSATAFPGLRVGVLVESPTFYAVQEDYSSVLTTFFDAGGSLTYGDQADDVGAGTFEYRVRTPWRFGVGAALDTPMLLLSADAEYVDWSQLEMDASSDPLYFDDVNRDIRDRFEPVINARAGGELRLGGLALRGGLAYQPDPINTDVTLSDGSTLDRSKLFFSAGVGLQFAQQVFLDFGWMQERFDDVYRPYGDVETDPPLVEESVRRNNFVVGLRYQF